MKQHSSCLVPKKRVKLPFDAFGTHPSQTDSHLAIRDFSGGSRHDKGVVDWTGPVDPRRRLEVPLFETRDGLSERPSCKGGISLVRKERDWKGGRTGRGLGRYSVREVLLVTEKVYPWSYGSVS